MPRTRRTLLTLPAAVLLALPARTQDPVESRFRPVAPTGAALELEAHWDPCRESKYGLFEQEETLREVAPAVERRAYEPGRFAPFLPPGPVEPGDAWEVDAEAVIPFLTQFHAGARTRLHHGSGSSPGAHALLRAIGPRYAEILLRAHAELELEKGITYTPAQFEGRLVVERESGAVVAFRLALPSRNTNVDVNVPTEYRRSPQEPPVKTMAADIGWVPRMELAGGEAPEVRWTGEISDEEARLRLARRFYAFAAIDWLPFDEAVVTARELDRPLHVVVLFGTLDDESC